MNYNITEVHNTGAGEDIVWHNIEINDLTAEQILLVLALIQPWYEDHLKNELAEHLQWMKEHQPLARTG
jgi:hypothetical protein